MLNIDQLIEVICLCLAAFEPGYTFGNRDNSKDNRPNDADND